MARRFTGAVVGVRMSGRRWLGMAALAVGALLVAGCGVSSSGGSASLPPMTYRAPSSAPEPQPEPSRDVQQDGTAALCSNALELAVDDIVNQQLSAFRARDFDAAFALASEQFRAITDAEGLKQLISKGNPEVLNSVSHEFAECRQAAPDLVLAAVRVTGANGKTVVLIYQFSLEDGQWRILQSAPVSGHGQRTAPSDDAPEAGTV